MALEEVGPGPTNKETGEAAKTTKGNQTVLRALAVLTLVSQSASPLSARQVGEHLSIDRLAAYRALMSLVEFGLVTRSINGRFFSRSLQMLKLTQPLRENKPRRTLFRTTLQNVAQACNQDCAFFALESDKVICVSLEIISSNPAKAFQIGHALPASASAAGRAILANLPRRITSEILQAGLTRETPFTVTDPISFLNLLDKIQGKGFAVEVEQATQGMACLAVPVLEKDKETSASICVSVAAEKMTPEFVQSTVTLLKTETNRLSSALFALD